MALWFALGLQRNALGAVASTMEVRLLEHKATPAQQLTCLDASIGAQAADRM